MRTVVSLHHTERLTVHEAFEIAWSFLITTALLQEQALILGKGFL